MNDKNFKLKPGFDFTTDLSKEEKQRIEAVGYKRGTQNYKKNTMTAIISRVSSNFTRWMIGISRNKLYLKRVINPLAKTEKK